MISSNLFDKAETYGALNHHIAFDRSSHQSVLEEKVFLEISQNSQESTCARVSLRTPFLQNTSWRLLLL